MKLARAALALSVAASTAVVATSSVASASDHICSVGDVGTSPEPASVIQTALDDTDCEVIEVAPGTYEGNLGIDRTVELVSTGGREVTTIDGDDSDGGLGTVHVSGGLTGVTIGGPDAGFTVSGIDGTPGLEHAAVYLQGAQTDVTIAGNDLVARGDAALMSEYNATVTGVVVDGNILSGQTFTGSEPAGEGFGSQFSLANVPRQLVVFGGGSGGGNTSDVTFTNNQITGVAGGANPSGDPQGNTLVTVDSDGATITGNTFAGTTSRFAASLRARGPATTITGNTFDSTGLQTDANGHVYVDNTGQTIDEIATSNTFDLGVYVDGPVGTIGISIEAAVGAAPAGSVIDVLAGTYVEGSPQVVIDRDLELRGADRDTTIVTPGGDTGTSGSARGWFLVTAGTDLEVSGMTFDGDGALVYQAFRHLGTGSFDDTAFRNIGYNPSSTYAGTAVAAFGGVGEVAVTGSTFADIGRIGVQFFGAGTVGTYSGNTHTGKGDGDFLDYALDIGGGATATITDSVVSGNTGVASSDGSTSAGVLVSTFFAAGTDAEIDGLTVTDSTTGVYVGYDDSDESDLVVRNSSLTGNDTGLRVISGTARVETTDLTGNDSAGIHVSGGAIVDAGQVGPGDDFTGLGVSAGGNDLSSYDAARNSGDPGAAIVNANINAPNVEDGPQGSPHDLTAQRNVFATADPADIEAVIDHDVDDLLRGFVDASSAVLPAPTAVSAAPGVVSAELSWNAPASGGEPVGYRIETSVDDGLSWATRVADTGSPATTATLSDLAGDTPTRFRVTALAAGGPSHVSEPSDAVTPAWRDRIGFDSIPTPFPNSLPSIGFQARSTSELGNRIEFDAVSETLETATVTMVNWAYLSEWEGDGYTAEGYEHPITLNLYEVEPDGEAGALIDSVTQDVLIEWRPESPASCEGGGWGASCSNGYAFPVEFDLTDIDVPDEVVYGVAYDTQSHGYDPIGAGGPYDSLNVGLLDRDTTSDGVSVGTDVETDTLYQNSTWAGAYQDGGATGTFRGDSSSVWDQYTPAVQFTFAAAVPDAVAAPVATAGEESASLTWSPPASDGGAGITGYQVEVSDDGGATWSVAIADTGSTDTSATVAPLDAGTPVVFRVSAINAVGTSDPSPASNEVTPTAPVASPPDDDDDDDVDQLPPPVDQLPPGGSGPVFVPVDPERFYDSRTTGSQVAAGEVVEVPVTDVASVPGDAPAVVVNVTATRAAMPGFVTVLPCGGDVPEASNLNYQADRDIAIMAVLPVSDDGTVCLYTSADVDLVLDVTGYAEADGGYAAVTPQRLADTRTSDGVPAAGSVVTVEPPQTDAEMLSLSVTTTMATEAGYFTVWACGEDQEQPDTSSLNFDAGRDAANLTMVANETICVYTSAESHVIVDLHGVIGPSIGVEPDRLVDTRTSGTRVTAGAPLSVEVDAVPALEASSYAVMNFTAVDPDGPGFMTVRPCSDPEGESSTVNFVPGPGTAIANLALVDVSEPVCVTVSAAAHVLVDVIATG